MIKKSYLKNENGNYRTQPNHYKKKHYRKDRRENILRVLHALTRDYIFVNMNKDGHDIQEKVVREIRDLREFYFVMASQVR